MPSSSSGGPRVLFIADAGPEIGGGHVMRCLTLARVLGERGAQCAFVATPEVAKILAAFANASIRRVESDAAGGFDAYVFDSFRMDANDHKRIAQGRPTLVIDNLADRPLACDLLMEPDPRDPADYAGLVPAGTKLLLGPDYALVRPEFAAVRDEVLKQRAAQREVRRVLVSMGLTDVGGISRRVVDRILPRLGEAKLDVVLGGGAPSLERLAGIAMRDPRVEVHVEVKDMATLMAAADVGVGAGGASIWERATLGLPTLLVVLAENQTNVAAWLDAHDASELADARADDFDAAFDRGFTTLMRSSERRARLSAASAKLCDGLGAERAADAFLALLRR